MTLEDKSYNRLNYQIRKEDEKLLDVNIDYIAINLSEEEKKKVKSEFEECIRNIKKLIAESEPVYYFEEIEY